MISEKAHSIMSKENRQLAKIESGLWNNPQWSSV